MVSILMSRGNVKSSFEELRKMSAAYPGEGYKERVESCEEEFRYMSDFMLRGFPDPQREKLFADLSRRVLAINYDLRVRKEIADIPCVKDLYKKVKAQGLSTEKLQSELLMADGDDELYKVLSMGFVYIYASGYWSEGEREEWETFLSSPKVPCIISATLVSALTLSICKVYSSEKTLALTHIYHKSCDAVVRARAFVGVIFAVVYNLGNTEEQKGSKSSAKEILRQLLDTDEARQSLMEMQIQMAHCQNVDSDAQTINNSIMPNIMKNQPFEITANGIVEKDEENDILDPHASERRAEAMEDSVRQMLDMQKAGSDIFYHGFSQMKRFPFFYKLANWFIPFHIGHPDIQQAAGSLKNSEFIDRVMKQGPFCDSDKYSFVIAIASVIQKVPENVREMMENGEVGPIGMRKDGEEPNESFIRLRYLQDLYRFYHLNPLSKDFGNPFETQYDWQLMYDSAEMLMDKDRYDMCMYIVKNTKMVDSTYIAARKLLDAFADKNTFEYHYANGEVLFCTRQYNDSVSEYKKCLAINKDNRPAMRSMARACYAAGDYAMSAFYYDALHTLYPDRRSFLINYIMAMVKLGEAEAVLNDIYRLEYENEGDITIANTLGWVLLYAQKQEKALDIYNKLLESAENKKNYKILINAVYANLFSQKAQVAVELVRSFSADVSQTQEDVERSFAEDEDLLRIYGFGKANQAIVLSAIISE